MPSPTRPGVFQPTLSTDQAQSHRTSTSAPTDSNGRHASISALSTGPATGAFIGLGNNACSGPASPAYSASLPSQGLQPTTTITAAAQRAFNFWDYWNNSFDFTDLALFYEPQGELLFETQDPVQQSPRQDFVIPQPVPATVSKVDKSNLRALSWSGPAPPSSPSRLRAHLGHSKTLASDSPSRSYAPDLGSSITISTPAAMKRKAGSESAPATSSSADRNDQVILQGPATKRAAPRPSNSRDSPEAAENLIGFKAASVAPDNQTTGATDATNSETNPGGSSGPSNFQAAREGQSFAETRAYVPMTSGQSVAQRSRRIAELGNSHSAVLPAGKVFPIQIGSELFRLSGASISSDAPSYFSHYFGDQLYNTPTGKAGDVKTLYIDRDPETFRDISLHLQGYHVRPRDGEHFVRLFADAQFYSLPRLTQQLFKSEIFIRIGDRDFQIPRDLFSAPGDSPNFFSLGFAHFFTTPQEVFPGLDRQTLLRPPSITPPAVPNRSGEIFAELLRLLQGYPVHIRDEGHRADLLRDARYFHLKGLEQRLLPCKIDFNLARERPQILMRLEDIRQSGISFVPDSEFCSASASSSSASTPLLSGQAGTRHGVHASRMGYVHYSRPFVDDAAHELVLEISTESTRLDLTSMRASFHGQTKARISSLFQVIASKMGLPATQPLGLMMMATGGGVAAQPASPANSGVSRERVRVEIGSDAWIEVDGEKVKCNRDSDSSLPLLPRLERETMAGFDEDASEWVVSKGHWRLRVQPTHTDGVGRVEVVLQADRIEAWTGERARNGRRAFLS